MTTGTFLFLAFNGYYVFTLVEETNGYKGTNARHAIFVKNFNQIFTLFDFKWHSSMYYLLFKFNLIK